MRSRKVSVLRNVFLNLEAFSYSKIKRGKTKENNLTGKSYSWQILMNVYIPLCAGQVSHVKIRIKPSFLRQCRLRHSGTKLHSDDLCVSLCTPCYSLP
jgi:hypothetical protein